MSHVVVVVNSSRTTIFDLIFATQRDIYEKMNHGCDDNKWDFTTYQFVDEMTLS